MKIVKIETMAFEANRLSQLLVRIITDEGLTGVGEAWYGSIKPVQSAIEETLAPLLLNEDSTRIEYLWHKMYRHAYRYGTEGVVLCALSGLDLALWDLMGKRLNSPVIRLLGGMVRDRIKAYASFPPYHHEETLLLEVKRAVNLGFAGIKLHEVDLSLVAAVRKTAGDNYPIMLDVNGQWNAWEAEENSCRLEDWNIFWLEEPLWPMQDHEAMAKVRRRVKIPFASGENEYTLKAFDHLMESGAADFIQPEITKVGGLTMARKISVLADLYNLPVCPHSFRIGPAAYANMHWALSQPNMEWMEVPLLPEGISFPANIKPLTIIEGQVLLPDGPGWGLPEF